MEANFLSKFITEDIYLINQKRARTDVPSDTKHLIITPHPLAGSDKKFLMKVFAAVNLDKDLIELAAQDKDYQKYASVFYFGVNPSDHQVEPYQKTIVGGCPMVIADSLAEIAADHDKKKKLWTVLKSFFN